MRTGKPRLFTCCLANSGTKPLQSKSGAQWNNGGSLVEINCGRCRRLMPLGVYVCGQMHLPCRLPVQRERIEGAFCAVRCELVPANIMCFLRRLKKGTRCTIASNCVEPANERTMTMTTNGGNSLLLTYSNMINFSVT